MRDTATAQSHGRPHSHHPAGHRALAAAQPATAAKPKLYNPRHPERTLLYQTIAEHFETWLELASAGQFDGRGDHHTPKPFVRQAFRKYLECGIFAYGFARARCDDCGHDYFVAFSCKGRGVCPSCNTRRLVETAAHLTDHVFPRLPVRQSLAAKRHLSPGHCNRRDRRGPGASHLCADATCAPLSVGACWRALRPKRC